MKLHTINAGLFKLDGGAMFGVVPKSMWQKLNPPDEKNLCTWALRCLLIKDNDRLILVDTGMGNKQDEKFFGHYEPHGNTLDSSLQKCGYCRDDITDVFLTHLHFDHCGGAVIRNGDIFEPAFKNADYWTNEKHWQWAIEPNEREKASFLKENILPLRESGRLKFIPEENNAVLSDHVSVRFAYGHTAAMMLPQISYKGRTLVYMADLLPSVAHIPLPYVMAYDMFPLITLKEKSVFLREAADNDYILYLEHDPLNECCTLQHTGKGIRAREMFALSEI